MKIFFKLIVLIFLCQYSYSQKKASTKTIANPVDLVEFTVLQINDFYEIAALESGKTGGAARIATVRKRLLKENPNVLTVLAGDFLSPSLIGTLKYEGERINGKQMIEVLNLLGLDLATFGNHEFDLNQEALQKRLNESDFNWVSSNVNLVRNDTLQNFYCENNGIRKNVPRSYIHTFKNAAGKNVQIGFVAPCLPANKVKYVHYDDIFESVKTELKNLNGKADLFFALSHLNKEDDLKMAKMFPELQLILGGHEHENMKFEIGKTILAKADANAKTVYVHRVSYDTKLKKTNITSNLVKLDETIVPDPEMNVLVQKWKSIETKLMREMGFDPDEVLMNLPQAYDAREIIIRNEPAAFCEMICRSMTKATSQTHCSIMNSGSVRVDDILKDKLSQYDILRSLPFGGSIMEMDMKGRLLQKILDAGWANKGSGGYLQWDRIVRTNEGKWFVSGDLLQADSTYHVAMNDFLLTGLETGLDFLVKGHPDIPILYPPRKTDPEDLRNDLRMAVIDYIKNGGR